MHINRCRSKYHWTQFNDHRWWWSWADINHKPCLYIKQQCYWWISFHQLLAHECRYWKLFKNTIALFDSKAVIYGFNLQVGGSGTINLLICILNFGKTNKATSNILQVLIESHLSIDFMDFVCFNKNDRIHFVNEMWHKLFNIETTELMKFIEYTYSFKIPLTWLMNTSP